MVAQVTVPFTTRPATIDDAHRIALLLREKDRREVEAISGEDPVAILPRAFTVDGPAGEILFAETVNSKDPILIGGVRPTPDQGVGSSAVWMVGTPLLERYNFALAREARRHVDMWSKTYRRLWNTAWEGNALHVEWLRFLGFTITGRFEHRGLPFIHFEKVSPPCAE